MLYSPLLKTINASECRYLTRDEQDRVMSFVNSMPKRMQAAKHVEQKEGEIVEYCIAEMKKRYPAFANLHESGWEKGVRDMQLVLRYNVQGMLMDDLDLASERLLFWLRTITASTGMTPKFVRDAYGILRDACRARLNSDAFALLESQLDRTVDVLSDFPEPLAPAV